MCIYVCLCNTKFPSVAHKSAAVKFSLGILESVTENSFVFHYYIGNTWNKNGNAGKIVNMSLKINIKSAYLLK